MKVYNMNKAIVFNPHNDDGIIGMGGTLIQLLEKGWNIMYIQMTDGRHGSNKISPSKLKKIRAEEFKKEREFLGVDKFYSFDIEDGTLGRLGEKRKREIIKRLVELIEDYSPNIVFLPGKAEAHIDHRMTYLLARKAIEKINIFPLEVYYLVWFFPFSEQDSGHIEKILKVPVDNWLKKKIKGIELHISQKKNGTRSRLVEVINAYFSLLYFQSPRENCNKCEVLGIHKVNENYTLFIKDLKGVKDVTKVFHGRNTEKIQT